MFYEYNSETLKRVRQSLFERYSEVFRNLGENDFDVEHTETGERQREDTMARSVELDREASKTALDWWVDNVELSRDEVF